MHPKYRALIWEQARVAGVIAAWSLLVAAVFAAVQLLSSATGFLPSWTAREGTRVFLSFGAFLLTVPMALRLDVRGHLIAGFEPRLGRLPLRTLPLTAIPLFTRALFLFALSVCLWGLLLVMSVVFLHLHRLGYRTSDWPFTRILVPVECYLLIQAVLWSWRSVKGAGYVIGAALFTAVLLLPGPHARSHDLLFSLRTLHGYAATWPAFGLVAAFSFGLALLGVHWERRDARHGLPTRDDIAEWRDRVRRPRMTPFRSAAEAQIWYERRRLGARLPLAMLFVLVFSATVLAVFMTSRRDIGVFAQYWPYVSLFFAVPVAMLTVYGTSAARKRPASLFPYLRPMASAHLAWAAQLALLRSFAMTLGLAFLLSMLGYVAFGPLETRLIVDALRHGETNVIEVAALFVGPLLFAACACWVALWLPIRPMSWLFGLPAVALIIFLLRILGDFPRPSGLVDQVLSDLPPWIIGILLIVPGWSLAQALRYRVVSWRGALILIACTAVGALLFWWPGPPDETHWTTLLLSFGLIATVLAPITAWPVELHLRRSR